MLTRLLLLLTLFLLAGCRLPSLVPDLAKAPGQGATVMAPGQTVALQGRIEAAAYRTQATLSEIGNGATVSLIDPLTGATVGTSISNASGSFVLTFGRTFVPVDGQAYFLEALKGVTGANSQFNQAGSDAVRLRTLVFYQATAPVGWKSLANPAPGFISLNQKTTALSVALSLKLQAGESLTLNDYIGALAVTPFVSVGAVSKFDYDALLLLVEDAVNQDRDPIHYTVYDMVNRTFANSWIGFSITDVTPKSGNINDTLTITGSGFDSGAATVSVNGIPAAILSLTADTITARVNPGSRTGPVSVQIGNTLQAGPTFAISVNDGHRAFLGGKLYVANPDWNTVSEVAASGDVKTILTGLSTPTQVTAGPDGMLYVSCKSANKVLKVDPTTYAASDFVALTSAHGLAFDTNGNLYVSSYQDAGNGTVSKFNSAGMLQASYDGFTNPTSLGFDYAGRLYVVEAAGGLTRLTPTGANGAPRTSLGSVVTPRGLAIDSGGYLYVASNDNNAVYRVNSSTGAASVFTMINKPGGLCFDEAGNLYVSDTQKNLVYRISPQGNLKTYAYGISNPRGLAIDPLDGTIYVSLNQSNTILKVNPANGILKPFVTGIANPLTLNFRGDGMFIGQPEIDTISFANRAGQFSTVMTGVTSASGADKASDDQIYIGRFGRPDAWQPNRDPLKNGGFAVVDAAGILQPIRYPYLKSSHQRAIDAGGNLYELSQTTKTLAMVKANPNGTKSIRRLHTFANTPNDVTYDAAGNVYVTVQAENAVYRFTAASDYAPSTITGFSGPFGLTIANDGAGALYVTNRGDGTIRRVNVPALDAISDDAGKITIAPLVTLAQSKTVAEISAMSGSNAVFVACDKKILTFDRTVGILSDYLGYDLPITPTHLDARSPGVLYTRVWQAQTVYTVAADKTYTVKNMRAYGGPYDFDPTWNTYETTTAYGDHIFVNNSIYVGSLGLNHEVAVDGNYLYVTSQGNGSPTGYGGLFRYELSGTSPQELYIPGAGQVVYSVAVDANRDVYVGNSSKQIHLIDAAGGASLKWTLGALPYGLDIYNGTLWAVGADCQLYDIPVAGTPTARQYGLMEPTF